MDDNYIEFELNGKKLRIHKEDSNDVCYWFEINGGRKLKNPYWKKLKLTDDGGYFRMRIYDKMFRHHRVVYYAHNQVWDILDISLNNLIDHEDRNKQNNHISNLRVGTNSLNNQNRKYVKGYTWHKQAKKYRASITINKKAISLGLYKTEEQAHQAYLDGKKKYHEWNV